MLRTQLLLLLPTGFDVRTGACQAHLQWTQSKVRLSTLCCMLCFDVSAALQVWLALEEKGIPYDTMFINLRKKPDWFKDVVPTNKVPAVSINGQMVWESDAILEVSVAIAPQQASRICTVGDKCSACQHLPGNMATAQR